MDSNGNVLIVEDDPEMREMLTRLLTTQGFYAVGAEDGLEALHLCAPSATGGPRHPALCSWI